MNIQLLADGTLLVPQRIEEEGVIGDAMVEVKPDSAEYAHYLAEYKREQSLPK